MTHAPHVTERWHVVLNDKDGEPQYGLITNDPVGHKGYVTIDQARDWAKSSRFQNYVWRLPTPRKIFIVKRRTEDTVQEVITP